MASNKIAFFPKNSSSTIQSNTTQARTQHGQLTVITFPSPETKRGMDTSFWRNDLWDHWRIQASFMIGLRLL